jgi:excisionase family DNA binding protein
MSRGLEQIFSPETLAALDDYVSTKVREGLRESLPGPEAGAEYISVKTASTRFDISESTIRDWIRLGKIRKYKIMGCVRLKPSEIVRELENQ